MNDNLMNGLKLVSVYDVKDWNWELFAICGSFFILGCILLIMVERYDSVFLESVGTLCVSVSLIVAVIIFSVTLYHNYFAPTREFKVICDESVSFMDIENIYDVISFDGEIYTIREEIDF